MVPIDIEFRNKDQELDFTRNVLQNLMSAVQDPVMILKPDFVILDANEALLALMGMRRDEVIGRKCHEVSHNSPEPCTGPDHACPAREAVLQGTSSHALHEHYCGEVGKRYFDVITYPILDSDGNVRVVLEIWSDISAILNHEVEKKTSEIKQDLVKLVHEDKMIALGKMVASAVHEINNPITAIHTFAKVMLRMVRGSANGLPPDDMKEMEQFLDLVANESKRCGSIVSNLLSFSRHQKTTSGQVNLNEVVGKILPLLKHKMDLQNIRIVMDLDPELPFLTGDLNQIQQAVMNLVFNAMEAMPEGGQINIRTDFDSKQQRITLEVRDSGCGIPPEIQGRLFEPFFSTRSSDTGVGLGLAVVYGIIKEHRGTIEFETEVGKGTSFLVSFPPTQS